MKFSTTLFFFVSVTLTMQNAKSTTDTWIDSGNGTVTDVATALVWQQQPEVITSFDNSQAIAYCQTLNLANKRDWRLPQIKELTSMVDHRKSDLAYDKDFRLGGQNEYWSATPQSDDPTKAWQVNFASGQVPVPQDKSDLAAVRCVRN